MKKLEFLVDVPDKYTKEMYTKGQVKEFEDKRAEEILNKKRANGQAYAREVVEEVETATRKAKAETAVKKTRKTKSIEIDLDKGTVKENDIQRESVNSSKI